MRASGPPVRFLISRGQNKKETSLMPSPQASPIHLSPIQQELLQRMVHRTMSEQRLVKRGHIILEVAQGTSNTKIAHQSKCS
jgi:hypothetical protein